MTLRFMHNTENVVFLGPPGVGKTHLSIALGMRAIMSDIPVYYVSAMKLVQTLKRDYDLRRLEYTAEFSSPIAFRRPSKCSFFLDILPVPVRMA